MSQKVENLRKKNLPWNGKDIAEAYLSIHPKFIYREQFVELILEGYRSYVAGAPKASIIVVSEALLRALYGKIIKQLKEGKEIDVNGTVLENSESALHRLNDDYTYHGIISILEKSELLDKSLINDIYAIKNLRNLATHGELPVLLEYDPKDQKRNSKEFKQILEGKREIPEAYQFETIKGKPIFRFEVSNHKCRTLKGLSIKDKFAAIQNLTVWRLLKELS